MKTKEEQNELARDLCVELSTSCDPQKVKELLDKGAPLNFQEFEITPNNPLMYLVTNQSNNTNMIETFKILIERGADINAIYNQESILTYCIARYNEEIVNILIDHPEINVNSDTPSTSFEMALNINQPELAKKIINKGLDVNRSFGGFKTHLNDAIFSKNDEIISLLLEKGAEINPDLSSGYSPLEAAVSSGNIDLAKIFIEKGAEINPKSEDLSHTPLIVAIQQNQINFAKSLILKGADVNPALLLTTNTPLETAVSSKNMDLIKFLVDKGAEVNPKSENLSKTPLTTAI